MTFPMELFANADNFDMGNFSRGQNFDMSKNSISEIKNSISGVHVKFNLGQSINQKRIKLVPSQSQRKIVKRIV